MQTTPSPLFPAVQTASFQLGATDKDRIPRPTRSLPQSLPTSICQLFRPDPIGFNTEEAKRLEQLFPELLTSGDQLIALGFKPAWVKTDSEFMERKSHQWNGQRGLMQVLFSNGVVYDIAFWTDNTDKSFAGAIEILTTGLGRSGERNADGAWGGSVNWKVDGARCTYKVRAINQASDTGSQFRRYVTVTRQAQ